MQESAETPKSPLDYIYRVSGHVQMITLPDGKIAKLCSKREQYCYERIYSEQSAILRFIAPYFGIRSIDATKIATAIGDYYQKNTELTASKVESDYASDKYLILEDLNRFYKCPCVLDMKLGTQTYWDGAPASKIARHKEKCKRTTSGSLGIRICGIRAYRPKSDNWFIRDKEWGNSLKASSLVTALASYFYDGRNFRVDILDHIVEKLSELRTIVEESNWRFYSSSILFTYEGNGEKKADIHLIDFGNCNFSSEFTTPDTGCILALSNLIACLRLIKNGAVDRTQVEDYIIS